jgi:NADH:ubiquinone oxidoreductase subunit 6 (subunit J)
MTWLFSFFSSVMLMAAVMVIHARNPVHAVLFLILVFCNGAGLLLLLDLDFFALLFLVVYVGAIAVLFLFVVMMLHPTLAEVQERRLRYLPVGGLLGLLFLLEMVIIVDTELLPLWAPPSLTLSWTPWMEVLQPRPPLQALGQVLYTEYVVDFLLASGILLVAMVGAILLTLEKSTQVHRQQVFTQNTRDFTRTVRRVQ